MKDSTSIDADRRSAKRVSNQVRPIQVTAEDELELLVAMDAYKLQSGRNFPTCSEILEVLCSLNYAKRIWTPVPAWSPISAEPRKNQSELEAASGVVGWFSHVETPVGL
jgi:hypothetical protein